MPRFRSRYSRFVTYEVRLVAGIVLLLVVVWPDFKPSPSVLRSAYPT